APTPTGFLEIVGAFFAPRWDVILRLKNSGTALSGMTLLPLDVGSGWDVGSSIRSGWGTAFRVFRRLQIENLHPNHVFLCFLSRRKMNNTKPNHFEIPLPSLIKFVCRSRFFQARSAIIILSSRLDPCVTIFSIKCVTHLFECLLTLLLYVVNRLIVGSYSYMRMLA